MSFKSIDFILNALSVREEWQEHQKFEQIVHYWAQLHPAIASHSRPVSLQRGVLRVATASSVWSQELSFKRSQLLQQLQAHFPDLPVVDIRFSTAHWQISQRIEDENRTPGELWIGHPSRLPVVDSPSGSHPSGDTPQQVFQAWAERLQVRMQSLPLCPCCHSPVPPKELERWEVCALCATKQWQKSP